MTKTDDPKPHPRQPALQRRLADAYEVTVRPDPAEAPLAATLARKCFSGRWMKAHFFNETAALF